MKLPIARNRKLWITIAALLAAASIIVMWIRPVRYGIDFTGGSLLERGLAGEVTAEQVRQVLAGAEIPELQVEGSVIQPLEAPGSDRTVFLLRTQELSNAAIAEVDAALTEAFGDVELRRTEVVGPVIGRELIRQATWAVALSAVAIAVYVTVRFERRLRFPAFGLAALAGLAFNVLAILAVIAWLGIEINTPFIAAVLTVVGYSINDTIVIFDRIRENLANRRRAELGSLVDQSVRQSLARSIMTSVTTLLALLAIYFFGGETLRDFVLTLILGVIVGTYTSLFIASPVWLVLEEAAERRRSRPAAT